VKENAARARGFGERLTPVAYQIRYRSGLERLERVRRDPRHPEELWRDLETRHAPDPWPWTVEA
jgi:hypothetical protein